MCVCLFFNTCLASTAMALGKQVKKYREKLNLTLEALSDRSGVDIGTISALENRDSKRSEKGSALARGLGLTLDQLLDETRDWIDNPADGAGASAPGAARVETPPPAAWPFDRVSPSEWASLGEKERGLVEGFVMGLLEAKGANRKSQKTGTHG